ncbi:MAG: hypothetical protein HKO95_08645 [Rhodobacteraceae bacterium]|nr:hypothetical protein [Alphaproteobacteria bacterium]MBT8473991.1 hypothetical protein [Alphaproteobacteria bacterium]NNF72075.1 hypothetical protein [Paracoccaceae bacterium]NNK66792.1 hypothetical protein [Paracoccaceae bacterium]
MSILYTARTALTALALWCAASLPVAALELIMVEEHGCIWCARWNAEIAPIYPKTEEGERAPLRRVDRFEPVPDDLTFARRVIFTPTFVLMRDGQEVGRIEGYPGEDFFWDLLERMILDADTKKGEG